MIFKGREGRLEYIIDNFSDISFPLKEGTVRLFKSQLIESNIKDLENTSVSPLFLKSDLDSSQLDEKKILKLLLKEEKEVEFSSNIELLYYFFFFKTLSLEKPMKEILRRLSDIDSFVDCFALFKLATEKFEKPMIRPREEISIKTFECSFTLCLFNMMREKEKEAFENDPQLFLIKNVAPLLYLLRKSHSLSIDPFQHSDFEVIVSNNPRLVRGNIILSTNDGKEFMAHQEILSYRLNFFMDMNLHSISPHTPLQTNIGSDILKPMIDFCSNLDFSTNRLEVLIQLIIISHCHEDTHLLDLSMAKLFSLSISGENQLLEKLSEIGYLLDGEIMKELSDEIISHFVISNNIDEKKIRETISCSSENKKQKSMESELLFLRNQKRVLERKFIEKKILCETQANLIIDQQITIKQLQGEIEKLSSSSSSSSFPRRNNSNNMEMLPPQGMMMMNNPNNQQRVNNSSFGSAPPLEEMEEEEEEEGVRRRRKKKKKKRIVKRIVKKTIKRSALKEMRLKKEKERSRILREINKNQSNTREINTREPPKNKMDYERRMSVQNSLGIKAKEEFFNGTLEGYDRSFQLFKKIFENLFFLLDFTKTKQFVSVFMDYSQQEHIINLKEIIKVLRRIAECSYRLDRFEESLSICELAISTIDDQISTYDFVEEYSGNRTMLYLVYGIMGRIMLKRKDLESSEKYIRKAERLVGGKENSKTLMYLRKRLNKASTMNKFSFNDNDIEKWVLKEYTESEEEYETDEEKEEEEEGEET